MECLNYFTQVTAFGLTKDRDFLQRPFPSTFTRSDTRWRLLVPIAALTLRGIFKHLSLVIYRGAGWGLLLTKEWFVEMFNFAGSAGSCSQLL